jgi:hypothetical protein
MYIQVDLYVVTAKNIYTRLDYGIYHPNLAEYKQH